MPPRWCQTSPSTAAVFQRAVRHVGRSSGCSRQLFIAAAFALTVVSASPALLSAQTRGVAGTAQTMAEKAIAAYLRGDFETAQRLYWQAYQLDGTRGEWAYGAARGSHKLGRFEEAATRYRRFLQAPGAAVNKVKLARKHLAEVNDERVKDLVRQARQAPAAAVGYPPAVKAAKIRGDDAGLW